MPLYGQFYSFSVGIGTCAVGVFKLELLQLGDGFGTSTVEVVEFELTVGVVKLELQELKWWNWNYFSWNGGIGTSAVGVVELRLLQLKCWNWNSWVVELELLQLGGGIGTSKFRVME
ncbi:hypothetical protein DPMN_127806 [Dreissena polymorpha]|uniref:Uncharacterized protein n=1 Tax=Dreissena polymorpha TaxID=45954 RepID=A0A9D4JV62_DREPO|nr:hypothetical protein DPMN_127806 [Dreissena polymorpha]